MKGTLMTGASALAGATAAGYVLTGAPAMDLATSMSGAAGAAIGAVVGSYLYYNNSTVQSSSVGNALGPNGTALVGAAALVGLSSGSWDLVTFGLAGGAAAGIVASSMW